MVWKSDAAWSKRRCTMSTTQPPRAKNYKITTPWQRIARERISIQVIYDFIDEGWVRDPLVLGHTLHSMVSSQASEVMEICIVVIGSTEQWNTLAQSATNSQV